MDLSKLYRPSALNSYQFIAITGLIMSIGAHLILHFFAPNKCQKALTGCICAGRAFTLSAPS
ncbi:hypothetical protein [Hymenobacter qilianensis]|uniref:hypothetical protein n=1 Tax=Hymenobacter qilianensis TaxID=1385715 RepID=UPI001CB9CE26|nr:hypothetical protein [Hymenobacter qilianensis]